MEQTTAQEPADAGSLPRSFEPYVLYELGVASLTLNLAGGGSIDMTGTLANGRSNYLLFEQLVRDLIGLERTAGSDHVAADGCRYEQKAYTDPQIDPAADLFQTSASSTFGANNNGPKVKAFLEAGDYPGALAICAATGYDHNDFYIYTNTRSYNPSVPFRFLIVPKVDVVGLLDASDPRLISRSVVLGRVTRTERL